MSTDQESFVVCWSFNWLRLSCFLVAASWFSHSWYGLDCTRKKLSPIEIKLTYMWISGVIIIVLRAHENKTVISFLTSKSRIKMISWKWDTHRTHLNQYSFTFANVEHEVNSLVSHFLEAFRNHGNNLISLTVRIYNTDACYYVDLWKDPFSILEGAIKLVARSQLAKVNWFHLRWSTTSINLDQFTLKLQAT